MGAQIAMSEIVQLNETEGRKIWGRKMKRGLTTKETKHTKRNHECDESHE